MPRGMILYGGRDIIKSRTADGHLKNDDGQVFRTMMHLGNTQVMPNRDRHNWAEKNLLRFQMARGNLAVYHSLRDAHGNESNNFSVATFGQ
jgi:hypothetical protein